MVRYLIFPVGMCLSVFTPRKTEAPLQFNDPVLAEAHNALNEALDRGYRWVRTDKDVAIFELIEEIVDQPTCTWAFDVNARMVRTSCGFGVDDIVDRLSVLDWKFCCYCSQPLKKGSS